MPVRPARCPPKTELHQRLLRVVEPCASQLATQPHRAALPLRRMAPERRRGHPGPLGRAAVAPATRVSRRHAPWTSRREPHHGWRALPARRGWALRREHLAVPTTELHSHATPSISRTVQTMRCRTAVLVRPPLGVLVGRSELGASTNAAGETLTTPTPSVDSEQGSAVGHCLKLPAQRPPHAPHSRPGSWPMDAKPAVPEEVEGPGSSEPPSLGAAMISRDAAMWNARRPQPTELHHEPPRHDHGQAP